MRFLIPILTLDAIASVATASPINSSDREFAKQHDINTDEVSEPLTGNETTGLSLREIPVPSYEVEVYGRDTEKTGEIIPSQHAYFDQTKLSVRIARRSAVIGFAGFSIWALTTSCKGYTQEGGITNGAQCAVGTISLAITVVLRGEEAADYCLKFAQNAITLTKVQLTQGFQDYVVNFGLGPFVGRGGRDQLGARDEWKRDVVLKRAEDGISSLLGLEVRHVGIWDGAMPGQPEKRDGDMELYPVFGFNANGSDFHFAYMGRDPISNGTRFKIGYGPGPETEENKRRLKSRETIRYNNYYFESGGLDAIGRSDIVGDSTNELDPNNSKDTDWLYDELACYLGIKTSAHPSQMDSPGLWWQVYDSAASGTLGAGAIAPFSADTPSIISWMKVESGLEVNQDCVKHDEL